MLYHLNIGSNMGDRRANIQRAVEALAVGCNDYLVSSVYESEPWGFDSDNTFVNVAMAVWSSVAPHDMLHRCQSIEKQLGSASHRDASGAYVDRVIDIDIILVDDLVIDTPTLTVPHPHMHERDFVMKPLQELQHIIDTTTRYKITAPPSIHTTVPLPASKSLAARLLIANALSDRDIDACEEGECDDTMVLLHALASHDDHINVAASGTAMRFLTAYCAIQQGRTVTIGGSDRMHQRPIGPLVDALRHRGACIDYVENDGYPPLRITGVPLSCHEVTIDGSLSSQYVSALLLIAPVTGGCHISIAGSISSRPYIEMTIALMRQHGIIVDTDDEMRQITVHEGKYNIPIHQPIEADWSAASYWVALQALLPQSTIVLKGLSPHSLQGDSAILDMCHILGVDTRWDGGDLVLTAGPATMGEIELNMAGTPDLVPTIVTTLCLLRRPFTISGIGSLRIKESDRIAALQAQLARAGYTLHVTNDNVVAYDGGYISTNHCIAIDTHRDHRMGMAMSLLATRHAGVIIHDAMVVSKSYPHYWQHLDEAGFTIIGL